MASCPGRGKPPSARTPRPLVLDASSSGDAFADTPHPDPSAHAYEAIGGTQSKGERHRAASGASVKDINGIIECPWLASPSRVESG
jgi:hypothetical protein